MSTGQRAGKGKKTGLPMSHRTRRRLQGRRSPMRLPHGEEAPRIPLPELSSTDAASRRCGAPGAHDRHIDGCPSRVRIFALFPKVRPVITRKDGCPHGGSVLTPEPRPDPIAAVLTFEVLELVGVSGIMCPVGLSACRILTKQRDVATFPGGSASTPAAVYGGGLLEQEAE